jgi:hypothetical protein
VENVKISMPDQQTKSIPIPPANQPPALPVKFIHEKIGGFQIFHADGAWGMVNNQVNAQLNFYIEHEPFPETLIMQVDKNGVFTGEAELLPKSDGKHFVIKRDFQVGVVLSLTAARQVRGLLDNFIKMCEPAEKIAADMIKSHSENKS